MTGKKVVNKTKKKLKKTKKNKNIGKISEDEENHLPTCVMGFFFSSFHKLYSPNLDNTIFKNVLEEDNPNITQLTFPLKNKKNVIYASKIQNI